MEYMTVAFVCGFSSVKDEGNVHLLDSMYLKGQFAICIIVRLKKTNKTTTCEAQGVFLLGQCH